MMFNTLFLCKIHTVIYNAILASCEIQKETSKEAHDLREDNLVKLPNR